MANANKRKGDVAERAIRTLADDRYPGSFKTRAGFNDDLGDVIVNHPGGYVVVQSKDVASAKWGEWYRQLKSQIKTARKEAARPVLGGVIVWKFRGHADPADWHTVVRLEDFLDLLDATYQAGLAEGVSIARGADRGE